MKRVFLVRAAAVALALTSSAARADVVTDWVEFVDPVSTEGTKARTGFDPATAQDSSKIALAIFEAANSVDRRYKSWLGVAAAPKGASLDLAVATAARDALITCYPGQKAMIEQRYTLALATTKDKQGRDEGIAAGRAAAAAAMKAGGIDPDAPKLPALWANLPAGQWGATAYSVIEPSMVTTRPWFLKATTQFRPPAPVALDSERWRRDMDEIRRMGGKTSTERTAADTILANFWINTDDLPTLHAVATQRGRTPVQNARMYALISMVGDDATIVLADSKIHYAFWRPIAAMRAGSGGVAATPGWEPLLRTPMHPEYLCGHCFGGAMLAEVIDEQGGAPAGGLPFASKTLPGFVVTVPTTADYVRQMNNSRIYGGVHFRSTADTSEKVARALTKYANAMFAPPIG